MRRRAHSRLGRLLLAAGLAVPASGDAATLTFEARLTPDQVVPRNGAPSPAGVATSSGRAFLELDFNRGDPFLVYEIIFEGLDLREDVTAIHFHRGHAPLDAEPAASLADAAASADRRPLVRPRHGSVDDVNGPHVLNVFGLPREDDDDLIVSPDGASLRGVWDNRDRNFGPDGIYDPSDSVRIGDVIEELLAGDIYIQVHTRTFNVPDTGELRGQIEQVVIPEPCVATLAAAATASCALRRRRHPPTRGAGRRQASSAAPTR